MSFVDVAIDLEWATPFQRALVDALRAVPRGEVVSYGELAALAGRPRARSCCWSAVRREPVRVRRPVSSRGRRATGSAGTAPPGVEVKRRLLALEGVEL